MPIYLEFLTLYYNYAISTKEMNVMNSIAKKVIAIALTATMALGFAACSSSKGGMTVEEGKLVVATNAFFPPYEYYEGEDIVGIDAEIAQAVADKLGLELVIEDVSFDSILAGIQAGTTCYTFVRVNINNIDSSHFNCYICPSAAACSYTFVTTDTVIISSNNSHNVSSFPFVTPY